MGQPARINPFDSGGGCQDGRRHTRAAAFRGFPGHLYLHHALVDRQLCRVLSAATGWEFTKDDAIRFGRRTATLMRAFNLRCGITPDLEKPSKRYGSIPVDGPAKGQDIGSQLGRDMVQTLVRDRGL